MIHQYFLFPKHPLLALFPETRNTNYTNKYFMKKCENNKINHVKIMMYASKNEFNIYFAIIPL